ncbi:MAG: phosphoenolpyruvate--protein phosphotransferase [Spirochaetia bacterium]|jgi:phosphotransferase system enzyme I (PtsI)|nr:phosphoenolpyruvate--protein phosphotransferase [Spirochaetia bacterium]
MADKNQKAKMILGIAVSPGIARGSAFIPPSTEHGMIPRRSIDDNEFSGEISRLDSVLNEAEGELLALEAEVRDKIGIQDAKILGVQAALLRDPSFRTEIVERCEKQKINVEAALSDTADRLTLAFNQIDDPAFRERAADFRDLARRLLNLLLKRGQEHTLVPPKESILVVGELLPTIIAKLDTNRIRALVAERGGPTAHAVILARSLGIPTVIDAETVTSTIKPNDFLIVDGLAGRIFINPSEDICREYDEVESDLKSRQTELQSLIGLPARTQDGITITLNANVGKVADATAASELKADGIGLYRTEFVFLTEDHFPEEEEQYQMYRATADKTAPRSTVIRVLDLGSDKQLSYLSLPAEANPSLGHRGTRLLLHHTEILRSQLRAILRLSATHPVSILFPMIGDVEEMIEARKAVESAQAELRAEGLSFDTHIRVGAMLETPSAAITARWIARQADFLSIGANDLVQYLLVSDRTSREMTAYYEPFHPAVIQALKLIVEAVAAEGKELSICGEVAGNPAYIELLLGLGIRNLSVTPRELLDVKNTIRSLTIEQSKKRVEAVLISQTVRDVKTSLTTDIPSVPNR